MDYSLYRLGLEGRARARDLEEDTHDYTREDLAWAIAVLEQALTESVKLQSHYANLLNMHDGGKRIVFSTMAEWVERLFKGEKDAIQKTK